jgi:DNA (cytosine-5)-methyltransferase 1
MSAANVQQLRTMDEIRAGLSGHPPPRREAGSRVAQPIAAGSPTSYRVDADTAENVIAHSLRADGFDASEDGTGRGLIAFGGNDTCGPIDVATAVNAHGGPHGRQDFESETFIAHTLTSEGYDAGSNGTHRGTPLIAFDCKAGGDTSFSVGETPGALRGEGHGGGHAAVCYDDYNQAVSEVAHTVVKGRDNRQPHAFNGTAVRRLTPRECERLQGFPPRRLHADHLSRQAGR